MIAAGDRATPGRLDGETDERGGVVVEGTDSDGLCCGSVGIGIPKWVGDVSGLKDPDVKMLVL